MISNSNQFRFKKKPITEIQTNLDIKPSEKQALY